MVSWKIVINWNYKTQICHDILDLGKIEKHEFWCDGIKEKYADDSKLVYLDIDGFIIHIITGDF